MKIKRKGAYEYERAHHQNNSALVVPKATELVLTKGLSPRQAVMQHTDMFDFCLFVKSPRLELDGVPQQGRTRYYVSTTGGTLVAVKPPPPGMKKGDYKKGIGVSNAAYHARNRTGVHDPSIHTKSASVYGDQISEVEKGWKVTVCNDILHCTNPINYDYYIDRVNKLVRPLQ